MDQEPELTIEQQLAAAKEIRSPVIFEEDKYDFDLDADFRPQPVDARLEDAPDPKGSSAQVHVVSLDSIVGLEDLSMDDLETTVPAEKDSTPPKEVKVG